MKNFKKGKYVLLYMNIEDCYDDYVTESDNFDELTDYAVYLKRKDNTLLIAIILRKDYEIGNYKVLWSI